MKKIIIVSILLCFILVGCGKNEDISGEFEYFYADKNEIMVENNVEVVFTASILTEDKVDEISVQTESGAILGYLYDDGTSEDQIANDNIFTGSIEIKAGEEKHENVVAVANNLKSQSIDFFFYNELTEEDYEQLNATNAKMNEIQQKYLDDEGYIQEENINTLFAEVLNYVKDGKETGLITEYSKEENCIYMEFSNGIGYMFVPNQKDVLSSGEAKRITTVEPFKDSFGMTTSLGFTWLTKKYNNLEYQGGYDVFSNAMMITESNDSYLYNVDMNKVYTSLSSTEYWQTDDDYYVNNEVTVDSIKQLADSKVIIWEGHGNYSEKFGSVLETGESATILKNLQKYSVDLKEKRLITTGGWYTLGTDFLLCNYAVTPKFFEYYFSDNSLDGCLVYIGACNSGTDDRLANSLISKGAKGVYCASGTMFMEYEMLMRTTIFYNLLKQTDSGSFYTAIQALEKAWKTIGKYDFKYKDTYITYYGDKEFRLIDNGASEEKEFDNIMLEEDEIEKNKLELGKDLNEFLSTIYQNGIHEYDFESYDIGSLMEFAYSIPVEGTPYNDEKGNYYYVVPYENVNNVLNFYFGITAPKEQIGDILFMDGEYHFPVLDYGELGMPLVIANDVELEDNKYKVMFDLAYIWPENFDTGELNPIENWNIYYDYSIDQIKADSFCEMLGIGYAVLERKGENLIVIEFHSDNVTAGSSESVEPLTKEEAYAIVEEYWRSLGRSMPEEVEYEGLTESGHSFWGYNMIGDNVVTHFWICVDENTGQITVEGGIYHEQ